MNLLFYPCSLVQYLAHSRYSANYGIHMQALSFKAFDEMAISLCTHFYKVRISCLHWWVWNKPCMLEKKNNFLDLSLIGYFSLTSVTVTCLGLCGQK